VQIAGFGSAAAGLESRSARDVADSRRESLKDGIETRDGFVGTAEHHAVSAVDAPDAAAGADVDVVNALVFQRAGAADIILVIRVAAVDDGVAGLHETGELGYGLVGGGSGGDHDPGGARLGELRNEILHRRGAGCAFAGERADVGRVQIEHRALMTMAHQAAYHVSAHPS